MKQRLRSKMIPLQHGHHRAFLGSRVFQMEDGEAMAALFGVDLLHDGVAGLVERELRQGCTFLKDRTAVIAEELLSLADQARDLYERVRLHLAVDVFHGTDSEIIDAVRHHVEADGA